MNLGGTVHINKTGCCLLIGALVIFLLYMFSNRNPPDSIVNKINLRQLLSAAIKAAEYGGKEVVASKSNLKIENKGKTREGANDSVTTADFKSHCVMVNKLKRSFPNLVVISEEETVCDDNLENLKFNDWDVMDKNLSDEWVEENDVKVWIDPLDATQEYTEKFYQYVTTMVCVAIKGDPIIGVIYKPFLEETTWAWVGKGKSTNLNKPKFQPNKSKLKFIVSRSHTGKVKEVIKKVITDRKAEIITAGGAGYKVLELTNGNADIYMHTTAIKKWDICAGNALLNALNGRMTTKYNKLIDYSDSEHSLNNDGVLAFLNTNGIDFNKLSF